MYYEIRYLDSAIEDLESILTYLAQFYPNTPKNFIIALKRFEANVAQMPFMYPAYEDVPQYRKALVLNYLVFYAVDETEHRIQIYRILHGAWDIPQYIF